MPGTRLDPSCMLASESSHKPNKGSTFRVRKGRFREIKNVAAPGPLEEGGIITLECLCKILLVSRQAN